MNASVISQRVQHLGLSELSASIMMYRMKCKKVRASFRAYIRHGRGAEGAVSSCWPSKAKVSLLESTMLLRLLTVSLASSLIPLVPESKLTIAVI